MWFPESGLAPGPVLARESLAVGEAIAGPAIIEATDSTIVVPPGWRAAADDRGFFVMEAP